MIHIVVYKVGWLKDLTALITEIKGTSGGWAHHIDNAWFVSTNESAVELYNRLAPYFTQTDYLFVGQIGPNTGWMPQDFWDWYNRQS